LKFIETEKDRLRREIRQARNALSPAWREAASRHITDRLWSWDKLMAAEVVHCYVAWRSEVGTRELIERVLGLDKKIVAPRVDKLHHILKHYYIQEVNDLVTGAFGIPEPDLAHCKQAQIEDVQLIIVPGVAFDSRGNRLGSGHGYYDRFLAQSSAVRVGLAFGMQIIDSVPAESHDEKMNFVVTEDEIIACAA
jgi:5-formyltetrahydrofolate cyclo-ligase